MIAAIEDGQVVLIAQTDEEIAILEQLDGWLTISVADFQDNCLWIEEG